MKIDALKFGGMRKERICCKVDAGRDRSAEIFTVFGQRVERGRCAKVNDASRAAVEIHHRHRIADPILPTALGSS